MANAQKLNICINVPSSQTYRFYFFFFLIHIVEGGVQTGSTRHVGHFWPIVSAPTRLWWRIWWYEDWQGKPKYSEETCLSATLFTTNPTSPDQSANPKRRGGKPTTNRLSYGVA
jgi:hypothetical protein